MSLPPGFDALYENFRKNPEGTADNISGYCLDCKWRGKFTDARLAGKIGKKDGSVCPWCGSEFLKWSRK